MENAALASTANHRPIRVAIIDDSASMRALIRNILTKSTGFTIVGEASDPYEGREMIKATTPDVVTLDIEMPKMSGLQFLDKIMRLRPMPVIMVSSLTGHGARESIEAMTLGAIDCVVKPTALNPHSFQQLPQKVRAAAGAKLRRLAATQTPKRISKGRTYHRMVAIGASTGGVEALLAVLTKFPADCPPTLIVQHMPKGFTTSFAQRLDSNCAMKVVEAVDGQRLLPGHAYLAPGSDAHLEVTGQAPYRCSLTNSSPINGHRPSVDALFSSLLPMAPNVAAAVLTGMGKDGAIGLKQLHDSGCPTLVQDEETSVVFGMPKAALQAGGTDVSLPLQDIAKRLLDEAAKASVHA